MQFTAAAVASYTIYFLMHKQHPQTAYRKHAILIGTIFENCDKKLNCYICIRCRDVKALVKTLQKTGEKVQRRKKSKKLVKKACKVDGDVVLYLSAKR